MEGTGDDVLFNLPKNLNFRRIDNFSSVQRVISLSLIIVFIVLINWLVGTHKIANFYNAILPHNQAFTELAFNNVYNLPSTIPANNQIYFSFWVHNVEGRTYTYPYTVSLKTGSKTTILTNSSLTLLSNARTSISEHVTVPNSSSRLQVEVTLTSLRQSIDFWLQGSN